MSLQRVKVTLGRWMPRARPHWQPGLSAAAGTMCEDGQAGTHWYPEQPKWGSCVQILFCCSPGPQASPSPIHTLGFNEAFPVSQQQTCLF